MLNNSMKTASKKFIANMNAPAFNQKEFILFETYTLKKNVKKLSYIISPEKQQILKEIQCLNNHIEKCIKNENKIFEEIPCYKKRFHSVIKYMFLIIILFSLAITFMYSMGTI